jgi:hypothetical protein
MLWPWWKLPLEVQRRSISIDPPKWKMPISDTSSIDAASGTFILVGRKFPVEYALHTVSHSSYVSLSYSLLFYQNTNHTVERSETQYILCSEIQSLSGFFDQVTCPR